MAYPILAAQNTWWKPNVSTVTRASITEIEIMDSYTPDSSVTVVDSWDASAAQDGSITCYVIGTKLIIAGNGSGKIAANEDSKRMFSDVNYKDYYSNVVNFIGAELLDVSNVTTFDHMFGFMSNVKSINVSNWDIGSATTIRGIFNNNKALTSVDVANWNTHKVTDIAFVFQQCSSLENVDVSNWDVSNLTDMSFAFRGCTSLQHLDMSKWEAKIASGDFAGIREAFRACNSLTTLNISKLNVSDATDIGRVFDGCANLTALDLSSWDVSNATNMEFMFSGCEKLTTIGNISNWNISSVTTVSAMFQDCSSLTGIGDLANWDTSNVTDMSFMFWGASSIGEIDVSNWDVSKVTNFDHFAAHAGLRRKGIEKWNTSSATNMNALFHNCAEEELDLSGWDVSNVQFFCQMFEASPNLKRIKGLENWDTSAGLGFDGMFERCYKLEELDLSSFDTSKAKNGTSASTNGHKTATLQNMFLSCNNLKKVTVGPNFSINGDGTNTAAANKAILPTPSTDYIEGADGMWYTFNGKSYAPNAVKDRTAETYYASYDIVADIDVICKNGSLLDTAKAIREMNGATDQYTPAQFGDAIRSMAVAIAGQTLAGQVEAGEV